MPFRQRMNLGLVVCIGCAATLCLPAACTLTCRAQSVPTSGIYPLKEVLGDEFVPRATPVVGDLAGGMSPSHWGAPLDAGGTDDQVPANGTVDEGTTQGSEGPLWYADPPAYEPEPTPYELRKNEKKKSPSLAEILNKGRYFAAVEVLWMEPHFLGSTALTETTGTTIVAEPFDLGFSFSPRFTVGFESEQGPGLEFKYWNINAESGTPTFTSDGVTVGQTSLYLLGPERWSRISADAAGESLAVEHELEAQSFDIEFFKEMEYKVSRLNGILGLHYASLSHLLRAEVSDAGGVEIGELLGESEFEGFGPKIGIEYFRPIGHTKLEMIGGIQVSLLFGELDQTVRNTLTTDFNLFSADELLSGLNAQLGVQYMHHLTEHRTIFARTTFEAQHWIGGGTATDPTSDFGIYGLTFGVGLNR